MAVRQHYRWGRGYRDSSAPVTARHYCWAHACRDGAVICGRVEVILRADTRLGLTAHEPRGVAARFVEYLQPALRRELTELVRRPGAAARRAAERMDPVEIVFDDPRLGLQRLTGWVQPPQRRSGGDLHDVEFDLHEPAR